MTPIQNRAQLLACLCPGGTFTCPVTVESLSKIEDLGVVTSLWGLTLGDYCTLDGLSGVSTLDGLIAGDNCRLKGLSSLSMIGSCTLGKGIFLQGLPDSFDISLSACPSGNEIELMMRIPLKWAEKGAKCTLFEMTYKVIHGKFNFQKSWDLREEYLPSMGPFFLAPRPAVVRYLQYLHAQGAN